MSDSVANLYDFDSTTGTFSAKDTSVVRAQVEADIKDVFGLGSSAIVSSTPMGRFVEWLTLHFATCLKVNVQNANQLVISSAAGQQLDALGLWFGLQRKAATRTAVTATVSGTAGTVVAAGSRAATEDGDAFELSADVTIGADGTASGEFLAAETGPVYCEAGALTSIDTQVNGWNGVTNPTAGTLGRDVETDDDFRQRIQESRCSGIGFIGAIKNAIESIDGVYSSVVIENYAAGVETIRGVNMDAHSIFVCVDCPETGKHSDIAKAILTTKPCGTGLTRLANHTNEKSIAVEDPYGNSYLVYFYLPESHEISVRLTYQNRSYSGYDVAADVKNAITSVWDKANKYKVGEPVYAADVIRAVEDAVPGIIIVNASVNTAGASGPEALSFVEVGAAAKAHFSAANISVTRYDATQLQTITIEAGVGGTGGSSISYFTSTAIQTKTITLPTRTGYAISSWTFTADGNVICGPVASGNLLTIPAGFSGSFTMTPTWEAEQT